MTCDDYRGIAINPIVSKVFEYCILNRFQGYLNSCDARFGSKKGYGCRNAIYSVRQITDRLIKGGSTVNMCAIDLSKAFNKVNHSALYCQTYEKTYPD